MAYGKVVERTIDGLVRFCVEWKDPYGKRKQRKFPTEAEAQRFADSPQVSNQQSLQPTLPATAAQSVADWVAWWLANYVPVTRAPKTARSYRDTMQRFVLTRVVPELPQNPHAIGHLPLAAVNVAHMLALLTFWKGHGYAGDTLRIMWATVSASLSDAVEHQLLSFNPLAMKPKGVKRLLAGNEMEVKKAMTQEQANQFLFAAKTSPLYAQFLTGLDSGLRIAEWRGLQLPDVLLTDGILTVNRQLAETGTQVGPTKGKRRREVILSNRLRTLLGKIIAER